MLIVHIFISDADSCGLQNSEINIDIRGQVNISSKCDNDDFELRALLLNMQTD